MPKLEVNSNFEIRLCGASFQDSILYSRYSSNCSARLLSRLQHRLHSGQACSLTLSTRIENTHRNSNTPQLLELKMHGEIILLHNLLSRKYTEKSSYFTTSWAGKTKEITLHQNSLYWHVCGN